MKCPKCQSEVLDDSRFCRNCGTPIHPSEKVLISQTRTILKAMEILRPGTELAGKYRIEDVVKDRNFVFVLAPNASQFSSISTH